MKKYYSILFFALVVLQPEWLVAQISGPTTGTTGTPITFSTPQNGFSYNWSFGTSDRDLSGIAYTPVVTNMVTFPAGFSPNYTSMVFDDAKWYSFSINANNGNIVRAEYGADPLNPSPTLTTLTTAISTLPGNVTKGIDVVYDSTDKRWFAVTVSSWTNGVQILDFGPAGLTNNAPTLEVVPTVHTNHLVTNQLTLKRWKNEWLCFVAGSGGQYFNRYDLGPNLGALKTSSPPLQVATLTNTNIYNFSLFEEDGNWYAVGADLSAIHRFSFGTDLKSIPTVSQINSNITPTISGNYRSVVLTKGCGGQVFGYLATGSQSRWKLDFGGSITKTSIASSSLISTGGGTGADGTAGFYPFVYKDTLYAAGSKWGGGNHLLIVKLHPLTGSETRYRDNSITHTFTAPGTYKVNLLIDLGSKAGSQAYCHEIVISSTAPPQPGAYTAAPTPVCAGQTGVVYSVPTVSGAAAYHWEYTGNNVTYAATTTSPSNTLNFQTNATNGTLKVWAADGTGTRSINSRDVAIVVNPLPTITPISGNGPVCVNATRLLNATPTGGTWSSGSPGIASVNGSNGTVTGVSAGTATITYLYKDGNGCSNSVNANVTVNALPTIAPISGNSPVCVNATRVLSTTPTGGTWSSGSIGIATVNSANGTVTGVAAGTATITYSYTDANSCSNSTSTNVTVNALPTIAPITGNSPLCEKGTRVLSTTPTGGTWSSGSTGIATVNSANGTVTGVAAGTATITYTYTNANSCTNTASANVTVNPLPNIAPISGNSPLCVNATRVLSTTPTGGTWSSGNTGVATVNGANGTVTGVAAGTATITYTYTDANSCTNSVTTNVTVNPLPSIAAITGGGSLCVNEIKMLSTTPTGGTWSSGSPGIAIVNASTGAVTGMAAGSSTITYSYTNANNCTNSASTNVTVNALPTVNISPASVAICAGESATLTASGANTYVWTPSGGNAANAVVSPTSTTSYTVEGTNSTTGCKNTATRQVVVHPLPVTQISVTGNGTTDVCKGDSVVITATGIGYNYEWRQDGQLVGTGNRHAAMSSGGYKAIAIDPSSGCVDSTQAIDIRVYDRPVAIIDQNDTAFCRGGIVKLEVESADTGLTYLWKENGVPNSLATAAFLEISETGAYQVIVGRASVANCQDSTNEVNITVHELPVINTTWDGEVLHAPPGYASYQWYTGTQALVGENDSTYTPASNGAYHVVVVDNNGCTGASPVQNLNNVTIDMNVESAEYRVYPNPTGGLLYIQSAIDVDALLLGMDGRILQYVKSAEVVDLSSYPSGVYMLRILNKDGLLKGVERIVRQ